MIRAALCALTATAVLAAPALAEVVTLRDSAAIGRTEYDLDRFMEFIMDKDYEAIRKIIQADDAAFNQATRDIYVYWDAISPDNVRIRIPGSKSSYYTRKYNVITP